MTGQHVGRRSGVGDVQMPALGVLVGRLGDSRFRVRLQVSKSGVSLRDGVPGPHGVMIMVLLESYFNDVFHVFVWVYVRGRHRQGVRRSGKPVPGRDSLLGGLYR